LLLNSEYKGCEEERDSPPLASNMYTLEDLESRILTSREELSETLDLLGAIEIQGYVRLVSQRAIRIANAALLDAIIEKNWDISSVDKQICLQQIPDIDSVLLDKCLRILGRRTDDSETERWELSRNSLIKAAAHIIFNESNQSRVKVSILLNAYIILFVTIMLHS
jgi:hypothetical protein